MYWPRLYEPQFYFSSTMEYQLKVENTGTQGNGQKWISFMVSASKVNCGQYSFESLVHDIKSRCPSLDFSNERTMRLRYLDDEDSWINLNFDDLRGFVELWQCARVVPNREFKRVKVCARVLGSPVQAAVQALRLQAQLCVRRHSCFCFRSNTQQTSKFPTENQQYCFHQ